MRYFNEHMTYPEAQNTLFSVARGKTSEEMQLIKKEYLEVLPAITRQEMSSSPLSLTEHPLPQK